MFTFQSRRFFLVALLLAGCFDASAPSDGFGILQGTVRDVANGIVLSNVTVRAAGVETATAQDGTFRLERVPSGRYEITAELADYLTFRDSVSVLPNGNTVVSVLLVPEGFALTAPTGIAAEPGPVQHAITILWPPLDDAVNYALYYSTSATVAPKDGTRIGGVTPPFLHRTLVPGQTYHYAVAGLGLAGEGPMSSTVTSMPRDHIEIRVESPAVAAFLGSEVAISVRVIGDNPLTSVRAAVGAASMPLTFNVDFGRWEGVLPLGPPPAVGPTLLVITATDALNNTASAERTLRR
jgi:molybdopterin-binding protein